MDCIWVKDTAMVMPVIYLLAVEFNLHQGLEKHKSYEFLKVSSSCKNLHLIYDIVQYRPYEDFGSKMKTIIVHSN